MNHIYVKLQNINNTHKKSNKKKKNLKQNMKKNTKNNKKCIIFTFIRYYSYTIYLLLIILFYLGKQKQKLKTKI